MKKRWLWLFLSLLISTGVYFTIRYGLRPKPIPVMKVTEFSSAPEIGAVIYRRLRQEIRGERVLFLGSTSELQNYADVWTGLLKTALGDGVQVSVLFQREGLMAPEGGSFEVVGFDEKHIHSGELIAQVKTRMAAGRLVVVHAATSEVTHLSKDSLTRDLDAISHRPALAISTLSLSLRPEEIEHLQAQCLSAASDGSIHLECAEARVSKMLLKKKPATGAAEKFWAVMERHGLKEYLVFVNR